MGDWEHPAKWGIQQIVVPQPQPISMAGTWEEHFPSFWDNTPPEPDNGLVGAQQFGWAPGPVTPINGMVAMPDLPFPAGQHYGMMPRVQPPNLPWQAQVLQQTASLAEQPRKRGRPRKHPLPDPNAPKRAPGRPKGSGDSYKRLQKGAKARLTKEERKGEVGARKLAREAGLEIS